MIAPDTVIVPAHALNEALTGVYGQVKRLEQGNPRPGESPQSAAEAQHALWSLTGVMREAMRRDPGVTADTGEEAARYTTSRSSCNPTALTRDFAESLDGPGS